MNRELFLSNAESFIKNAKDVYQTLVDYQVNLNKEITAQVDKINSIGEQILDLNKRIREAEASGLENAMPETSSLMSWQSILIIHTMRIITAMCASL